MEETSRRSVLGRHQSCDSKRSDILSDSIECNHSSRNTSSLLYSKSCQTEDWRSLIRQSIRVTSTFTKDLITSRWDKRIGFESCSEVVRQTKFFQSTQPTPNSIRDRSGRPDDMQDERRTSRSQEISVNSFNEELSSSDRRGRPVETGNSSTFI